MERVTLAADKSFETSEVNDFIQGKPVEVAVEFFAVDQALPRLKPGVQFKVWAGKDVGAGEVLSIQSTSDDLLERARDR